MFSFVLAAHESSIFKIVKMIMERNFAPVITFSFSRKECEAYGMQMAKLDFNTGISRQHWNISQSNGPPYLQLWYNDGLFPFYAFACRNRNRVMLVMKRNAGGVGPIFWVYLNQGLILDEHATRGEPMILTFMFARVFSTFAQERAMQHASRSLCEGPLA